MQKSISFRCALTSRIVLGSHPSASQLEKWQPFRRQLDGLRDWAKIANDDIVSENINQHKYANQVPGSYYDTTSLRTPSSFPNSARSHLAPPSINPFPQPRLHLHETRTQLHNLPFVLPQVRRRRENQRLTNPQIHNSLEHFLTLIYARGQRRCTPQVIFDSRVPRGRVEVVHDTDRAEIQ